MSEPFTIWGSGFKFAEPFVVRLRIDEALQPILGSGTANGAGGFSIDFDEFGGSDEIKASAVGVRTVVVVGADGSSASAPVNIVTSRAPTPSISTSLMTEKVTKGETTTIWGAGFKPNEPVSIAAVGAAPGGEDKIIAGGTADANGALSATSVAINLDAGVYTLRASGTMASEASAPLVVVEEEK